MSKSSHLNVSNRHEIVSFTSAFTDRPNSADHSAFLVSLGPCLGKSEIMNKQLKRHVQYLILSGYLVSIIFHDDATNIFSGLKPPALFPGLNIG